MKKRSTYILYPTLLILLIAFSACNPSVPITPTPNGLESVAISSTLTPTFTPSPESTSTPVPIATLFGGGTGKLVYVSCGFKSVQEDTSFFEVRDDNSCELYRMNTDGSDQINLTNNSVSDADPAPSPDGTKIAYVSDLGNNAEIFVMNVDGSNKIQLTHNNYQEAEPAWSPDGNQFVFVAHHVNQGFEIKIMDTNGGNEVTLIKNGDSDGNYLSPAWSPLGTQIAFVQDGFNPECQGCSEIFVMNVDGSNLTQITHNNGWSQNPIWSIDGTHIGYETYVKPRDIGFVVMNPDGSGQSELANTEGWDSQPSWSPDGRMIAFQSDRGQPVVGDFDIYVMSIEGRSLTRLTNNINSSSPAWLPMP